MNIENANIGSSRDLSRGAPVHVSQPQRWANTNRLPFIAVWQKPTRLELNPPKTTTQSWGLIQSPNIRGNVRTLVHLSSVKNPPRRKTQSRDALLLSNLTCTFRMWWVSAPEVTVEPVSHQLTVAAFTHFYISSYFIWRQASKKLAALSMGCALKWRSEKAFELQGILRKFHMNAHPYANTAPLCTEHRSGDWCGRLCCHCTASYFTVMSNASGERRDSVQQHMFYSRDT